VDEVLHQQWPHPGRLPNKQHGHYIKLYIGREGARDRRFSLGVRRLFPVPAVKNV
jgi:hypothetical protein